MKLSKYRIVYSAYYNYRAVHNIKKHPDVWIVEELDRITFFGLFNIWERWTPHDEDGYDIRFRSPEEAFAYVERLLNGNPRNEIVKTVVTEVDHERIN